MFVCGRVGFGVWMGVGCPCPPVRNDIVTPRHLLDAFSHLYKRLCPSERFTYFLCMFVCVLGVGVRPGIGCPCPPVRNDIVTLRHLY